MKRSLFTFIAATVALLTSFVMNSCNESVNPPDGKWFKLDLAYYSEDKMEFSVTPFDKNMVYFCYFAKEEDMAQYRDMEKFMAKYADVADLVKIDNFYKGDVSGLFVKLAPQTKYIAFVFGIDGNNKPLTDTWVEQAFKTGEGTTKEMYTVFDEVQKTLTYFYDGKRKSRQGTVELLEQRTYEVFETYADKVLKVIIDKSFKDAPLTDASHLFWHSKDWHIAHMTAVTSIEGLENITTSRITDMHDMFWNFGKMTTLDLSSFNTSNVTDMSAMFSACDELTSLDLSNFNTEKVTDMSGMFNYCNALASVDLSSFNTSNVTDMHNMFAQTALTTLDLSHFDFSKITETWQMFYECNQLTTIYCNAYLSEKISTENSENMFLYCTKLKGEMGTEWDSSNPTDKSYARPDKGPDQPGYFTTK